MSEAKILQHNPLSESEKILRDDFYGQRSDEEATNSPPSKRRPTKPKPTHYKVVCISLYTQDIENLEATVAELKRRGYTKANKSQLIRQALRQFDIDKLPPPQM